MINEMKMSMNILSATGKERTNKIQKNVGPHLSLQCRFERVNEDAGMAPISIQCKHSTADTVETMQ